MKQKNVASLLKHRNDFCGSSLKREIVRKKRYAERICPLNKKILHEIDMQKRTWISWKS